MKINFVGRCCVEPDKLASNIAHTKSLGLPFVDWAKVHSYPVALIGGGPSINQHVEAIREWPGDVWAVNGARSWCERHSIDAAFLSIDPNPILADLARGAKRSIVATQCDPSVFEALRGSDVRVFDLGPGEVINGPTTASAAPALAIKAGYPGVVFFGCEGSWDFETHAYRQDEEDQCLIDWKMLVECGGREFLTCAGYLMQAQCLSETIRMAPHVFNQRGGGLMAQMIETPEFDIKAVAKKLAARIGLAA